MELSELTNKELKYILRQNNIKNYSKLNKKDLVKKVNQLIKAQNGGKSEKIKRGKKKKELIGGTTEVPYQRFENVKQKQQQQQQLQQQQPQQQQQQQPQPQPQQQQQQQQPQQQQQQQQQQQPQQQQQTIIKTNNKQQQQYQLPAPPGPPPGPPPPQKESCGMCSIQ